MLDLSRSVSGEKRGKEKMTRKQDSSKATNWKDLMAGQEEFLRPLVQEVIQQVLESEMDEALGPARASARRAPGISIGILRPSVSYPIGKLEVRVPRIGMAGSGPKCLNDVNGVKR